MHNKYSKEEFKKMKGKEKSMRIAVKDASYDLMEKLFEKHCGEKWTVIHHEDTNLQELLEIPTDGTMICITCRYIVQEKSFSYNISKVTRKVNKKTVYYFSILDHNTNEIISLVKDEDYSENYLTQHYTEKPTVVLLKLAKLF